MNTDGARVLARQICFFSAAGLVSLVVDMATLTFAVRELGLNLYSARLLSFLVAATTAWALNRTFTFARWKSDSRVGEWLRFIGFNLLGGAVNVGMYAWLIHSAPFVYRHPLVGVASGSLTGLVVNFLLSKLLVFRPEPKSTE